MTRYLRQGVPDCQHGSGRADKDEEEEQDGSLCAQLPVQLTLHSRSRYQFFLTLVRSFSDTIPAPHLTSCSRLPAPPLCSCHRSPALLLLLHGYYRSYTGL